MGDLFDRLPWHRPRPLARAIRAVKDAEDKMAITQAQFDTDLAAYNTAVENLIVAANAAVAKAQGAGVDMTTEDAAVQKAATDVATEITNLGVTPPAPPAQ